MTQRPFGSLVLLLALFAPLAIPGVGETPTRPQGPMGRGAQAKDDFESVRAHAEELVEGGAFAEAAKVYGELDSASLTPEQARWVRFRLADCSWRAQIGERGTNAQVLDGARADLTQQVENTEVRDATWAGACASLAELLDSIGQLKQALPAFQKALGFWERSRDIETARRRTLDLVDRMASGPAGTSGWLLRRRPAMLPIGVLRKAARIAIEEKDRARTQFWLAQAYAARGRDLAVRGRAEKAYRAVLALGKGAPHYDESLSLLAEYLAGTGRPERTEDGTLVFQPDYEGALALDRRLLEEFQPGESAWIRTAESRIQSLLREELDLQVVGAFLPGATPSFQLRTRNLEEVRLALYPVDLNRFANLDEEGKNWLWELQLARLSPVAQWRVRPAHAGDHRRWSSSPNLEGPLPPGAYVFEARGGGQRDLDLVLVSDLTLTVKAAPDQTLIWATQATTGQPVPGASVRLHRAWGRGAAHRVVTLQGTTDEDGVLVLPAEPGTSSSQLLCTAVSGQQQARCNARAPSLSARDTWRIFAHTDRPAYRPGQTVHWKLVARRAGPGGLTTPAGEAVEWILRDPRGTEWKRGSGQLDEFGAIFGELVTEPDMALGTYSVRYRAGDQWIGDATLFRLEEYELPEFEVSVEPARNEDGSPLRFAPGDTLEADIVARYTSGGPVQGARVQVTVTRSSFSFASPRPDPMPWLDSPGTGETSWGHGVLYFDAPPGGGLRGSDSTWLEPEVGTATLFTDGDGRAHLELDTEFDDAHDTVYRIEARVIDASRREIVGVGSVRGTRTPYFASLTPRRRIVPPGSDLVVDIRTETGDGIAVAAKGRITCSKQTFVQRWIGPGGEVIEESERVDGEARGLHLDTETLREAVVATADVATDADGEVSWRFRPKEPGSYVLRWHSPGDREQDVTGETQVFVADESTRSLGVVSGGIEILVNDETVVPGEEATLVLIAPSSGRYVLLTTETETIDSHRVVHMAGTVQVLHLPITRAHVPNLWIAAVSNAQGRSYRNEVRLRVPPVASVLDVTLTPDREDARPGEEGSFTLQVKDSQGRPVEAQLSLAVIDASVLAIQGDLAGDPRSIFLATPRRHGVQTSGSQDGGGYRGPGDTVPPRESARVSGEDLRMLQSLGYASDDLVEEEPEFRDVIGIGAGAGGKFGKRRGSSPSLRKDFRETALWIPDVVTDAEGRATVTLTYPDSTTRWRALTRVADRGGRFGVGETKTHTKLPLTTRLAVPRFLTVGDEATLSCNLVNETDAPMELGVRLELEGVERMGEARDENISVPAHAAKRLDWNVVAREPGDALVRVFATQRAGGKGRGDAMERRFTVQPHGIEALVHRTGRFAGPEWSFDLDIPAERDRAGTKLSIQVTPNLAVTMLDALPYLADYPYGCTEQTLSRFVPSVVVAKTLRELGLDPTEAMEMRFGGIEEASAAATHGGKERDLSSLDRMTAAGLARLIDFQHASGGFGWWKESGDDPFMTAYALFALSLARDAGVDVPKGMLQRAARYLSRHLVGEHDLDRLAFSLFALSTYGGASPDTGSQNTGRWIQAGFSRLSEHPGEPSAYGRALWALAAQRAGREADARAVVATLLNGVVFEQEPDRSILQGGASDPEHALRTAHWGHESFHSWSDNAVESTAYVVLALSEVDPGNSLLEPAVQWLVQNRRGAQWSNTRETATTVLALASYLREVGLRPEPLAFEIEVNGASVGKVRFEGSDVLRAPSRFEVDPSGIVDGANHIRIVRTMGDSALTFAASATFFSLEEPIPARGNVLFVHRRFDRLVGHPTLLAGVTFDRVPLRDGDRIETGDRIESVLIVEAKNDLEYVLLQDEKPAGLASVESKSGRVRIQRVLRGDVERLLEAEGRAGGLPEKPEGARGAGSASAHREMRTDHIAFFIDRMGQGFWEVRTTFVARTPGTFHALPALGEAMYVPEIRSNGRELRMGVDSTQ